MGAAGWDRRAVGGGIARRRPGKLVLADGSRYPGVVIGGGRLPVWGEVVFNTSMTGYQEIITDPSYAGQIVVMTYPQIGNYGVQPSDCERDTCAARGLVVRELSTFFSPGPGRRSLESFMIDNEMPGLSGVDTRAIALRIRSGGAVAGVIGDAEQSDDALAAIARSKRFSAGERLVDSVTGVAQASGAAGATRTGRAAIVDFGVKESIVSLVRSLGVQTEVMGTRRRGDGRFDAGAILSGGFDFVVLSNGPGDPADVPGAITSTQQLIGRVPIFGICLGHQITALALGAKTFKLKFGHRGANHPVRCHDTDRVMVTSQNHGYAVGDDFSAAGPPHGDVEVTYSNLNDGTVEGFRSKRLMIECVQFHPEASPGPHDSAAIVSEFYKRVKSGAEALELHNHVDEVKRAQPV